MRIKLYENRDFMRRTQIKLMQEEVHIWCIRWKEVIPVGVDIQEIIDCSEYLEIARSFFEPEEVKNIEESNSKELFFQYWSAKEAYLKAIGVGLLKGMSFFSVKDGVIKENGRKKDHWKLIPIKVQGYAAYIALKEKRSINQLLRSII